VDEAAANTVTHGYAGTPGWIEVAVAVEGEEIVVTLEDVAPTFDPTLQPEPDMTVSALVRGPHGMGVHLMRLATDRMTHQPRDGGGNILTLTRSRTGHPEENR
jgi:serine/threonine-protein kinase RsbW